jgi:hypothetical protein
MKGHHAGSDTYFYWDDSEAYHNLALAIIRRAFKDAQLCPENYASESNRREAEYYKADALAWLAAVQAMSPEGRQCNTH